MASQLLKLTGAWATDVLPTQTTLTHIDPTHISGIVETLLSASSAFPTVTKNLDLYHLARVVKGAKASLLVVSAEHYIATATNTQELPLMTQIIWNATMELQDLEMGFNLYQMDLSMYANVLFAFIFAVLFVCHSGISIWKKHHYFGFCMAIGTALEVAGYSARAFSIGHYSEKLQYLVQIISLTLAPAFIMAAVYYLLAQLLVIHGTRFSKLKPLWFSYVFIFCDVSSLIIQAAGGGIAAIRLQNLDNTKPGTHVMLAGIVFQVMSMTLFLYFMGDFLLKIYFKAHPQVKFLVRNLFSLLFQTKRGRQILQDYLQPQYNLAYQQIWSRRVFGYYPLAIIVSVLFIYVRCVYRVVELSEGWTGYLITHEEYVMTLDGCQVLLTSLVLIAFHPGFIFGTSAHVSVHGTTADKEKDMDSDRRSFESDTKLDFSWDDQNSSSDESHMSWPAHPDPYFIPKVSFDRSSTKVPFVSEIEAKSVESHENEPSPKVQTDSVKSRHFVWSNNLWRKKPEETLVSVPYHATSENAPSLHHEETHQKAKPRKQKHADTKSVASFNPYTRSEAPQPLRSSWRYEDLGQPHIFYEQQKREPEGDVFDDSASQVTSDEFFFLFGTQK